MAIINIIPKVKEYIDYKDKINFKKLKCNKKLSSYQYSLLAKHLSNDSKNELKFILKNEVQKEGYEININKDNVECYYSSEQGAHNAILTLKQLLSKKNELTTCLIKDEPNFELRSVMIDISRNKVPKLKTLKKIVDELALVKINDLQLYIEGRSFYFESLSKYYENKEDFLTGEDIIELRKYANARGIEITPNFNCYGHMAYWLNQDDLKHLALNQEGFTFPETNAFNYPQTINSQLKESKDFLFSMFDDILKYFPNGDRCTIGGDEPFELLFPTRNPNAKELYENQIRDVINYVKKHDKTPYMWSDVARAYPEMLSKLKDVVLLDWCYEASWVNEERMKFFEKYQVPFIICPGTSGWFSFSGRMENMLTNYKETAVYGKKYHAKGYMLTDWNDGGSFTQLVTNIATYIYGACFAWNDDNLCYDAINKYLDDYIYLNNIAENVIELGRYNLQQDIVVPGMPKLFAMFFSHQIDGLNFDIGSYSDCAALNNSRDILNYNECDKTIKFLDKWIQSLNYQKENDYIKELIFEYRLIRHSVNLNLTYLKLRDFRAFKEDIEYLLEDINSLIRDYPRIWNKRNKKSDFKFSIFRLKLLKMKYKNYINLFNQIKKI